HDLTPTTEGFRFTPGCINHVTLQVSTIAFSESRLVLWRIRGEPTADDALCSLEFNRLYGLNPLPMADPAYSQWHLLSAACSVRGRGVGEGWVLVEAGLDKSVPKPHTCAKTELLARLWGAGNVMVHAGQLGSGRRVLVYPPLC